MTERLSLVTTDGVTLEARIDSPQSPTRMTVFAHPSPVHGGSMNAPLMIGVARRLVERGHTVLRFNFRGVGGSTGEQGLGKDETLDVSAAVEVATDRDLPLGLAGWSFGAAATLNWLADEGSDLPYVGIAPPAPTLPTQLPEGPKTIVLGDRDQVIDRDALRDYAEEMGIDLIEVPGDHFFHGRGRKIGDLVGEALER